MSLRRLLAPFALSVSVSLSAQMANPASPGTTVSDLGWLQGHWTGAVNGGELSADLIFSAPGQGSLFGVARITQGNTLAVVELISLIDAPSGPQLRFRHFGGDLKGWEPDFQQNMILTARSDSDFTFTNQAPYVKGNISTMPRITRYIRRASDVMVGRSDIIGEDGRPAVVESVYRRVQ